MKEQIHYILEQLVIKNNIRLNQKELKLQLLSHPSYPSLHAFTGVLDHFKINNLALKVPTNIETLEQLPSCWIAQVETGIGKELVLVERGKTNFKLTYHKTKKEKLNQETFLQAWKGIILAIEKDEQTEEVKTVVTIPFLQWLPYFLCLLILGFFLFEATNFFSKAHFILSIVGLGISVFIVKYELGLHSEQTNRFCNLSGSTSCDEVLHSKGATLFGRFKLSDISLVSFVTFISNWILFLFLGYSDHTFIAMVSLFAIPFVIYSLHYQYQVVKKWCPLCLGIVIVLFAQMGLVFLMDFFTTPLFIDLSAVLVYFISLLISIGLWTSLKPLWQSKVSLEKLQVEHYKFKRNFSLFNTLHNKEVALITSISVPEEIILGNENAKLEIILVTNPLCYYCKQAHSDIEKILRQAKDQIKVILRFNINPITQNGEAYQIASQLLSIYTMGGKAACEKALNEVYSESADLQKWLQKQKHPVDQNYDEVLKKQKDWCEANQINFTPALYLEGKQYPMEYDRKDLVYFVDNIIETQENESIAIRNEQSTVLH